MTHPRYRTLDGDELELPLAMDRWVLVPRALARFDPELTWALDYEDAPDPEDADPRLDFSAGALLVPIERWDEHAILEPNLGPCQPRTPAPRDASALLTASWTLPSAPPSPWMRGLGDHLARGFARAITLALAWLALAYVLAVAAWLWSLRHRITAPDVSTGLLLVGLAVLLAWLAGVAGAAVPDARFALTPPERPPSRVLAGFSRLGDRPVTLLRLGLTLQLAGFVALAVLR